MSGRHPDAHLDLLSHRTDWGWVTSTPRVCLPPKYGRQKDANGKSALGGACGRDSNHLQCCLCVGGVISLGCVQARCGRITHRPGDVWHEPLAGHGQHLALSTLPPGVAPSKQCSFGVVVVFVFVIGTRRGWESVRGVSRLRPDQVLTMGECERIDEKLQCMFCRDPTVGTNCSYQNSEPWHVRVDVVKWGLELHTSI